MSYCYFFFCHYTGLLWATLLFSIFPLFYCSASCPSSCQCNPHGEVICVGYTITEIPKNLPVHTYTLKLNDTNMNVIKEHSLAHQDLLLRFSLTHSHLHTIHDLEIYLDGNQLETLAPEMFEGLAALLVLDLTRNKLTGPGAGIFDGLTNLTVLNLGRNNIKNLEEGIFDQLTSLEELILHGNKIEGIAPQVFWSLGKLKILTLSGNHLQTVPHKSFYNMPELSKLTIYKNPLLSLPNELMALRILNLSKNPWDCNCAIRDFARWIRNNPRIVVDIDDVLCHSPTYHVLRRVNSLRDDEFTYCDEKRIQTSLYEPVKTTHVSTTTEEVRRYSTARMRLHKSLQPLHVIPTTPLSKSTASEGTTQSESLPPASATKEVRRYSTARMRLHKSLQPLRVIPTTPLSKSTASEAKTQLASLPPASSSPTILLDILLIEQVPEYVHHYHHRGWVYVWFLPSDTDLLGFLMFCYILLLAAGLLIILAAVYGMHRLSVAMEALKAGCA
uniref:LRRCT domain-containing protein n=1 Tax=Oryzias sinensis TaxID=183150 RepID=A0A8C7XFM5_9TELE